MWAVGAGEESAKSTTDRPARPLPFPAALIPAPGPIPPAVPTEQAPAVPGVEEPPARALWVAALAAFALVFFGPLIALAAVSDDPPSVRVFQTDGRVSALVADGGLRVLILNSTDPRTANAALGEARPWEPGPDVIVAPSTDDVATGLLSAIRASSPQSVIIAGLPGAGTLWHALERECESRGIDVTYTVGSTSIVGERVTLTVFGIEDDEDEGRAVIVRRTAGGASVAIALDRGLPRVRSHVVVTTGDADAVNADLIVTTDDDARPVRQPELALGFRERARLLLNADAVEVFGGTFRGPSTRSTDE
jgi:hypothetical protein